MFLAANNSLRWLQIEGSEPLDEQLQVLAAWYSFCAGKLRVFKVINGLDCHGCQRKLGANVSEGCLNKTKLCAQKGVVYACYMVLSARLQRASKAFLVLLPDTCLSM